MKGPQKSLAVATTVFAVLASAPAAASPAGPATARTTPAEYTVVLVENAGTAAIAAAVRAAGGRVTAENPTLHAITVTATAEDFAASLGDDPRVVGVVPAVPIGRVPDAGARGPARAGDHAPTGRTAGTTGTPTATTAAPGMDPYDSLVWGHDMIQSAQARRHQAGRKGVYVAIMDGGIDSTHPDLAANLDKSLSRNFVRDIPEINGVEVDGPCEFEGCVDPADQDAVGHGTRIAATAAAAANGIGISGVAPNVTLVSLRVAHDSWFVFLDDVLEALTYAAQSGMDVIDMPFFIDPWMYHCWANPADSRQQQRQQRATIVALTRAVNYARSMGATIISTVGDLHENMDRPNDDTTSPNFPPGTPAHTRDINPRTCAQLPVQLPGVIGVNSVGPSGQKTDVANYGLGTVDIAAPGGWMEDFFGTDRFNTYRNQVLAPFTFRGLLMHGEVTADGEITDLGRAHGVFKECTATGNCGYYAWRQGTPAASGFVTGVAALIVSEYGRPDPRHPGTITMDPKKVEQILLQSATPTACPEPRLVSYANIGRDASWDAYCAGGRGLNGFYGHGIVNARAAVTRH
jgi:subtilisin family serine protease